MSVQVTNYSALLNAPTVIEDINCMLEPSRCPTALTYGGPESTFQDREVRHEERLRPTNGLLPEYFTSARHVGADPPHARMTDMLVSFYRLFPDKRCHLQQDRETYDLDRIANHNYRFVKTINSINIRNLNRRSKGVTTHNWQSSLRMNMLTGRLSLAPLPDCSDQRGASLL